ncbi:MAG: hypothetical protein JWL77_4103 [Chthonomonadaceae bacterium]|nr:hypothetical protein [Chthonomonadaceae bacterium]
MDHKRVLTRRSVLALAAGAVGSLLMGEWVPDRPRGVQDWLCRGHMCLNRG